MLIPTLVATAIPAASTAAELVRQARALNQVDQQTWRLEDVEAQIRCYLHAINLLCETREVDESFCASVTPTPTNSVAEESFEEKEVIHQTCAIGIHPLDIAYELHLEVVHLGLPLPIQQLLLRPSVTMNLGYGHPVQAGSELLSHANTEASRYETSMQTCCIELAYAYNDRYLHADNIDDIERQLCFSTYTLSLLPGQPSLEALALLSIGTALRSRYSVSGNFVDLECALAALRQALYLNNTSGGDPALYLQELACCLRRRYEILGCLDELSESINLLRRALDLTPVVSPSRPYALFELAQCQADRHTKLGNKEDAEEAHSLHEEALRLRPVGHRDRYHSLHGLGVSHFTIFQETARLDDLQRAIILYREGLEICPASQCALFWTSLCSALRLRFVGCGDEKDLDDAVRMGREALKVWPHSAAVLTSLGEAVNTRFRQHGDFRDLEESIRMHRATLQICRPGHPRRALAINNLAGMLVHRCEHWSFDSDDLGEAIALLREASELCPQGTPEWSPTIFSLSKALKMRFMQTTMIRDLREATELHANWLARHIEADCDWRCYLFLDSIAELYRHRFDRLGEVQDINEAINIQEEAFRIRPEEYIKRHLALSCLAIAYRLRAELLNTEDDAQNAMKLQKEAAASISLGHRDRAQILLGLSRLYLVETTADYSPKTALDLYCDAITDIHCTAQVRLCEGLPVLDVLEPVVCGMSLDDEAQSNLLHAYRLTVHLLPQVAYFGLDAFSRLKVLAKAPGLTTNAAVHAMHMSKPELAIEIMEEGRAVFWAQYLRLRSSFDQLPAELAKKLTKTSRLLQAGAAQVPAQKKADNYTLIQLEEHLVQHRRLSEDFVALIEQARSLPGFERFMLNDTFSTLLLAAQTAPVLILLATPTFCGALLMRSPTTGAEQLCLSPVIEAHEVNRLYADLHKANWISRGAISGRAMKTVPIQYRDTRTVLEQVWHKIAKVIIEFLGWKRCEGRGRPRLMICPTGPFTQLPIHAAGTSDEGCLDYFVPSYTPTLGVLLAGQRNYRPIRRTDARILLAAVPRPFKWAQLPYAIQEVENIKNVVPAQQFMSIPSNTGFDSSENGSASSSDVLNNLPGATILHLACHGHHDPSNALNSGFVMRDNMLTVTELMKLNLPNSFLAFLSACDTAKSAETQPDQAIHLAATMLFAGFKSVIGTMWSMGDVDGPAVAKRVYEEIFSGDSEYIDPDSVPYALDAAVGELRQRKLHPSRWAPYIHLGI